MPVYNYKCSLCKAHKQVYENAYSKIERYCSNSHGQHLMDKKENQDNPYQIIHRKNPNYRKE